MQCFETKIIKDENGRLTFIELPFDAQKVFTISKGTIIVKGKINDIDYRNKLLSRGKGNYILVLNKALQKMIGFNANPMTVQVTMMLDQEDMQNSSVDEIEMVSSDIDVITAIKSRKSVRKFISKHIEDKTLNTILNAGMQAPTAKNKRPYHFIVVKDKELLSKLASQNSNASMLMNAACGIIVCGDSNVESMKEFLYADCAAATQNILLCSHGLGIGAVWCGVVMNSDWKKFIIHEFNLPLKMLPVSVIALGYPNEKKETYDRWDSGRLHFEKW